MTPTVTAVAVAGSVAGRLYWDSTGAARSQWRSLRDQVTRQRVARRERPGSGRVSIANLSLCARGARITSCVHEICRCAGSGAPVADVAVLGNGAQVSV